MAGGKACKGCFAAPAKLDFIIKGPDFLEILFLKGPIFVTKALWPWGNFPKFVFSGFAHYLVGKSENE